MTIISDRIHESRHIYDVKVPISHNNATLVPARAKIHAKEFIDARKPRAVIAKIYEEGFPVETGAVIQCNWPSRYKEYVLLSEEEDKFQMLKTLEDKGDGVLLK